MKMKRKIVLHGPSTLTISLPASWVKKFNIKKGDELNVEEHDKELRINTEKEFSLEKRNVEVGDLERVGRDYITSLYIQGCDEIFLKYNNSKFGEVIQYLISKEILGFEIIKQGNNTCLIKDLTGHNIDEFNNSLRRMWLLILDLSNESLDSIRKNDIDRIKNVKIMDSSVNKFSNYCLRLLIKKGHVDFKRTPSYYHFIKSLEEVADRYKDLCNFYLISKEKVDKNFIKAFEKINQHLNEFYELFYKYEEKKVEILIKKTKSTHREISSSGSRLGIYLSSICKDISDLLGVLTEINL